VCWWNTLVKWLYVHLVEEGMDLGLRVGGPATTELVGKRLGRVHRHLVASSGWVEENGVPTHPDDLRDAHGLVFAVKRRWEGWPMKLGGRRAVVRPASRTSASSGDFLRALACRGAGIALLPDWLVHDDLKEGRLVELLPDADLATLDLWLVWPSQRYQSASARRFIGCLADEATRSWPRA